MQQHLPQQEIQKTGLSVEAPSLYYSDMLKAATVMQKIMIDLSEAVIKRQNNGHYKNGAQLNETKWLLEFIDCSKS
jgi:hypothetical protein